MVALTASLQLQLVQTTGNGLDMSAFEDGRAGHQFLSLNHRCFELALKYQAGSIRVVMISCFLIVNSLDGLYRSLSKILFLIGERT